MTRYQRAPGAASAEVDGEVVVLSPSDLRYHALNEPSAAIWELLEQPSSPSELVDRLLDAFDVERAQCEADVAAHLTELEELGLVLSE
jgi:PqqD family protein of HPr-rel-A system